jgi:hypothetical protein
MPFVVTIFLVVLGVTALVGVLGYLIDRSVRRHDDRP